MVNYKLTYFAVKSLAEGIRLLLTYGDEKFDEVLVTQEEWPSVKPSMPFGAMPILEFDGKTYPQSMAICRYLGKKYGLVGKNALEDLEIDIIMDAVNDFRLKCADAAYEQDEANRAKKFKNVMENIVPFFLEKFDAIAAANNGHLALGKLTWVDFYFAGAYDFLTSISQTNIGEKAPNLKKVVDNVLALPAVIEYYKTAPKYDIQYLPSLYYV